MSAEQTTEIVPALDQGLLVLFESITALISPDDWARHLPACGYTDESPTCRCGKFGADLIAMLRGHDAAARADERERWADEREHLLAPFAALADEYEATTNPAPYTSERALWERFSTVLAAALTQPTEPRKPPVVPAETDVQP